MSTDELFRIATDPGADQKTLRDVWDATKSSRVRKAVVSNPNCDSVTMKMGARLYIKEVVNNPSFELLKIFDEDKFVSTLYSAYTEPDTFLATKNIRSIKAGNDRVNVARAILTSPKLKKINSLVEVCSVLTSAEFKRELKDEEVKKNVKDVAKRNLHHLKLPTVSFLLQNDILDLKDVDVALDTCKESYRTSKGTYLGFIKSVLKPAMEGDDFSYRVLFKYLAANRADNIKDMIKESVKESLFQTPYFLKVMGSLYRDFLAVEVTHKRKSCDDSVRKYRYGGYYSFNDSDHSKYLAKLIWSVIAVRNMASQSLEEMDLEKIYNDIALVGFDKDHGPHECSLKLQGMNYLTGMNVICQKLATMKDDKAFEFFITSKIVWKDWYAKGSPDNPETKVLERLYSLNEKKFKAGEAPLVTYTVLGVFPEVRVTERRGGLEYTDNRYFSGAANTAKRLPPIPSGRLSTDDLEKTIKKFF